MISNGILLAAIVGAVLSFAICYFLTRFLIRFLVEHRKTVLDYHKIEKPQVPRPGGPAVIAGLVIGEFVLFFASMDYAVLALALATLLSGIVGIVDDLYTLGGVVKPALLLIAGVPIVAIPILFGLHVYSIHLYLPLFRSPTNLPILYPLLVLVAIPVTTNTINTIDVLNGVVSGFILISLVPVTFAIGLRFYLGTYQGPANGEVLLLSVLPIFAAIGAFFLFHRYPSKIFPGDSGALAMGGAYGALAIIGGVEFVAMIAILPAILNSFFFLSSVRKLVEHREIESNPTVALPDTRILSNTDPKAPVTLMRLIVAFAPLREDEIASDIFKVSAFCSVLAIITALLTWGFAIG